MPTTSVDLLPEPTIAALSQALRDLQFGSVEIVVHGGRVVQVERRERVRITPADHRPPDARRRIPILDDRTGRTPGGPGAKTREETAE